MHRVALVASAYHHATVGGQIDSPDLVMRMMNEFVVTIEAQSKSRDAPFQDERIMPKSAEADEIRILTC